MTTGPSKMFLRLRHLSPALRCGLDSKPSAALNFGSFRVFRATDTRSYIAVSETDSVYKSVFGDWKGYTFKRARLRDFPEVSANVLNSFLHREKINSLLEYEDKSVDDHNEMVRIALSHQLTVMIIEKNHSSKDVIGVNLIMDSQQPGFGFVNFIPISRNIQRAFSILGDLEEMTLDAFNSQFKTDRYAEICMTSILANHQGRGILHELYKRNLLLFKAQGFQTAKGAFTSPATQHIARKLGFQELGRILYRDYKDPFGVKVFPKAKDDSFVAEMAIAL